MACAGLPPELRPGASSLLATPAQVERLQASEHAARGLRLRAEAPPLAPSSAGLVWPGHSWPSQAAPSSLPARTALRCMARSFSCALPTWAGTSPFVLLFVSGSPSRPWARSGFAATATAAAAASATACTSIARLCRDCRPSSASSVTTFSCKLHTASCAPSCPSYGAHLPLPRIACCAVAVESGFVDALSGISLSWAPMT